jgi:uncharacterized protein GlcG (DUF336 family)
MTPLTLAQASIIVDKALEHGRAAKLKPLTVVVLDAGGHQIAEGKAWGTLGMGFGGREFARRVQGNPAFMTSLMVASEGRVVPNAGGVLIKDDAGNIIGAVGISGDTSENDEAWARRYQGGGAEGRYRRRRIEPNRPTILAARRMAK